MLEMKTEVDWEPEKIDFEIFGAKGWKLFEPLFRVKGGLKYIFWEVILASIIISGQKMPKKPL